MNNSAACRHEAITGARVSVFVRADEFTAALNIHAGDASLSVVVSEIDASDYCLDWGITDEVSALFLCEFLLSIIQMNDLNSWVLEFIFESELTDEQNFVLDWVFDDILFHVKCRDVGCRVNIWLVNLGEAIFFNSLLHDFVTCALRSICNKVKVLSQVFQEL